VRGGFGSPRELLRVAKQERGCTELVVETTADWDDAVAFYLHNGSYPQGLGFLSLFFLRILNY